MYPFVRATCGGRDLHQLLPLLLLLPLPYCRYCCRYYCCCYYYNNSINTTINTTNNTTTIIHYCYHCTTTTTITTNSNTSSTTTPVIKSQQHQRPDSPAVSTTATRRPAQRKRTSARDLPPRRPQRCPRCTLLLRARWCCLPRRNIDPLSGGGGVDKQAAGPRNPGAIYPLFNVITSQASGWKLTQCSHALETLRTLFAYT